MGEVAEEHQILWTRGELKWKWALQRTLCKGKLLLKLHKYLSGMGEDKS